MNLQLALIHSVQTSYGMIIFPPYILTINFLNELNLQIRQSPWIMTKVNSSGSWAFKIFLKGRTNVTH